MNDDTSNKFFEITKDGNQLLMRFSSSTTANEFGRMDFYSRLLHSMKPDDLRVWRETDRLNVEIKGWPKSIKWTRISENEYSGQIINKSSFDLDKFEKVLNKSLKGTLEGEVAGNGVRLNVIEIGNGSSWKTYKFYSKARTIAALCVLYDMEPHPRNDLEINVPQNLQPQWAWPMNQVQEAVIRVYGDPSKTADVLRNEGWSREGSSPGMEVFNQNVGGARQQMYKLLRQEQDRSQQVMRTNIPSRWKRNLYESQDYTCRICGLKYDFELLAPDHRVPVIFQADELTEANYNIKLMTLCRFCNQQKREFCKRINPNYDWDNSPWAYPEKFVLKKIKNEISQFAKIKKLSINEVLKMVGEEKID